MSSKEEEYLGRSYFALVAGSCASAASFFGKMSGEIDGAGNLVWNSSFKCKHFEFITYFPTQLRMYVVFYVGPDRRRNFLSYLYSTEPSFRTKFLNFQKITGGFFQVKGEAASDE